MRERQMFTNKLNIFGTMTDVQNMYLKLGKLEKEELIDIIMYGRVPECLQDNIMTHFKERKSVDIYKSTESVATEGYHDDSTVELDERDDLDEDGSYYEWPYFMGNKYATSNDGIQDFYWKEYIPGKIPDDAVESVDGKYIGQVKYEGKLLPACIFPESDIAVAERYGKRVIRQNIKILCCPNPNRFYWEEANFNDPPSIQMKNVFVGGYQDGYNLFIGKTCLDGEWKIGKVVPHVIAPYKGLQIWNKNDEFAMVRQFHILKYNLHTVSNEDTVVQDLYWRNYSFNGLPDDAIKGIEGKNIYIGQVNYQENLLPVAIYPNENVAIAEWAGKREFHEEIQILCAPDYMKFYWEKVNFHRPSENMMKNAVKGGHQEGYNLYIGKAYHKGKWKIGKVVPMSNTLDKGLQIWGNHNECVLITEFEMLKCHVTDSSDYNVVKMNGKYATSSVQMTQKKQLSILHRFRSILRVSLKRLAPPCCSAPKHYSSNLLYCNAKQDFYWRDYIPGKLPQDAVNGGEGNYIGQVNYEGKILPACIYPEKMFAVAERYGKRVFTENIKILCCQDPERFTWEHVNFDSHTSKQLTDIFVGGRQDGYDLYVGKIFMDGQWNIGKVVPHTVSQYKGLQVIDKNSEFNMYRKFYILKYNPPFISYNNNGVSKV